MKNISTLQSMLIGKPKVADAGAPTLIGDSAVESAIVLLALRSRCSDKEFVSIATESATEMEIHEVVDSEETVTDAVEDADTTNALKPEAQLAVIELAKKNQDTDYIEYVKHITLAQSYLASLIEKYSDQAISEASEIVENAKEKAANIPTKEGKEISDKLSEE